MSRPFADNRDRPTEDASPEMLSKQLLEQVLSATSDAKRQNRSHSDPRYELVVARWRGAEWRPDTVGASLVEAALQDWLQAVPLSTTARHDLIQDIAQTLFDDPVYSVKFAQMWQELQGPNA